MTITGVHRTAPVRRTSGWWWLLVLPAAPWAAVRLLGWEVGPLVQLFAFTPYVAALSLIPAVVTAVRRRWRPAAGAGLIALVLAACVLPRFLPDLDRGPADGTTLRVLTANLLAGAADPDQLVGLVRDRRVDVLALQEFTPAAQSELETAGLAALLPHRAVAAENGTSGSAVYSRYPLAATGSRRNPGGFLQAYGTVAVAFSAPLMVESVHPLAPYGVGVLDDWRDDLAAEPRATPGGPLRILLGDFNATLDHAALRDVLDSGYRDAADAVGAGLIGTWGPYDGDAIPPVTLDHVFVDERIGVAGASVHDLTGSDHRAVFAEVRLPRPS